MVLLKYLSNFRGIQEMLLINCEIDLILIWSDKNVLSNDTKAITFTITDAKLDDPVVTLSTKVYAKLLQQLKSGLKEQLIGTNINQKYQYKPQNHISIS